MVAKYFHSFTQIPINWLYELFQLLSWFYHIGYLTFSILCEFDSVSVTAFIV